MPSTRAPSLSSVYTYGLHSYGPYSYGPNSAVPSTRASSRSSVAFALALSSALRSLGCKPTTSPRILASEKKPPNNPALQHDFGSRIRMDLPRSSSAHRRVQHASTKNCDAIFFYGRGVSTLWLRLLSGRLSPDYACAVFIGAQYFQVRINYKRAVFIGAWYLQARARYL